MMNRSGSAPIIKRMFSVRHYGFIGLMTCFVLGILISTVYTLHRLHEDAVETHFTLGAMYARTFEDHLTQSCNFIDSTLTSQINEITPGKPPEALEKSFKASLLNMPYLRSLSLVDSTGTIIASSTPRNTGRHLTEGYIPVITETSGFLQIGKPWLGRDFADGHELVDASPVTPDNLGFIPLLRTFELRGVPYTMIATLNPDYFINYYRQILGYEEDHVELLRYDGTPLLYTGSTSLLGSPSRHRPFISGLEEREFGKFERAEPGYPPSLVSYRASRLFPLVIVTQIDRSRALAQWENEKKRLLLVVLPALLLVVTASLLLYRRQRRAQAEQIEAERREHEKFASTVFDTVAEAVLATDAEARIVLVNPALSRVTGYAPEELLGKTPSLFSTGLHDAAFYRQLWKALKQTGFWEGEIHNRRKDGRLWIVWASISRVRDAGGRVTHYVAGYSDITERKQMEESLRSAKEQAESATRAKSEFLASMSHEIRTPMNGVIGMTGLLLDTRLDEEQRKYAEIVRNCGENLLELINGILDFSKIEAHHLVLEEMPFDLRNTLEDTLEILATKAHDKGLEITSLVDPAIPWEVTGDPGRLRQILMNLAGNAIKFTEKGDIAVTAELLASGTETLQIRFKVRDTGIGIAADRMHAVFEPFTQADGSTTRKFGGTGLGLAICKQLCRLMGGEIGVESTEGIGSTFWFTISFKTVEPAREQAHRFAPIEGLKVLVVDDNATNRQLLSTLLSGWGCRYETAADGPAALHLLREARAEGTPFRIALLDYHMPGMDGFALAGLIRKESAHDNTVLVMLTSLGNRGDAAVMHQAGFSAYLTKPIRQQQLHDCLSLLAGRQTADGKTAPENLLTRYTIEEAHRSTAKILLAEDNQVNQAVAVAMLKKLGYRADVVGNGLEALEALSRIPYNLVLMDCQMPEMDGFEATAAIRNATANVLDHTVPIIAMTANAMQGDSDKCIQAGMNDYLSKPVKPEALGQVLEKWLKQGEHTGEQPSREDTGTAEMTGVPSPEIFNPSTMHERLQSAGIMQQIIEIGLSSLPERIAQLTEAVESRDSDKMRQHAHTLKGMAGDLSAEELHTTIMLIEDAIDKREEEETARLLQQARNQATVLMSALKQWHTGYSGHRHAAE